MKRIALTTVAFMLFSMLFILVTPAFSDVIQPSPAPTTYLKTISKDGTTLKIPTINMADSTVSYQDTKDFYQFNITLSKLPSSNIFSFPLETQGIEFYLQPPLNEELDAKAFDFINATHAIKDGTVRVYRPMNVVNSYAVYKTAIGVGTGKLYQFYRPLLIDSKGGQSWANLSVTKTGMTIIADVDWLSKAVYPVVIDPTFGYTTIGSSDDNGPDKLATKFTMPGNGNVTMITFYGQAWADVTVGIASIYSDNAGAPDALLANSTETTIPSADFALNNFTISYENTGGSLVAWLTFKANGTCNFKYDSGDTSQTAYKSGLYAGEFTDPFGTPDGYLDWKLTVFATYTSGGDTTPPTYSGLSVSTTVSGASSDLGITVNDETDLTTTGGYILEFNGSNSTWTAFTSTPETVSESVTLTNTVGSSDSYNWYFNDTAGNWNSTGSQSITLTADTYTVTLSGKATASLGETVTITIGVSRAAGLSISSYSMNITQNGGLWFENYTESDFTFSESSATTHTFSVTGLVDDDSGASVTPTITDLSISWQSTGGGGGGGTPTPTPEASPSPSPTSTPDEWWNPQLPELPEINQNDLVVVAIAVVGSVTVVLAGNTVGSKKRKKPSKDEKRTKLPKMSRR